MYKMSKKVSISKKKYKTENFPKNKECAFLLMMSDGTDVRLPESTLYHVRKYDISEIYEQLSNDFQLHEILIEIINEFEENLKSAVKEFSLDKDRIFKGYNEILLYYDIDNKFLSQYDYISGESLEFSYLLSLKSFYQIASIAAKENRYYGDNLFVKQTVSVLNSTCKQQDSILMRQYDGAIVEMREKERELRNTIASPFGGLSYSVNTLMSSPSRYDIFNPESKNHKLLKYLECIDEFAPSDLDELIDFLNEHEQDSDLIDELNDRNDIEIRKREEIKFTNGNGKTRIFTPDSSVYDEIDEIDGIESDPDYILRHIKYYRNQNIIDYLNRDYRYLLKDLLANNIYIDDLNILRRLNDQTKALSIVMELGTMYTVMYIYRHMDLIVENFGQIFNVVYSEESPNYKILKSKDFKKFISSKDGHYPYFIDENDYTVQFDYPMLVVNLLHLLDQENKTGTSLTTEERENLKREKTIKPVKERSFKKIKQNLVSKKASKIPDEDHVYEKVQEIKARNTNTKPTGKKLTELKRGKSSVTGKVTTESLKSKFGIKEDSSDEEELSEDESEEELLEDSSDEEELSEEEYYDEDL